MDENCKMLSEHKDLIRKLYEYVKECLQFKEDAKICFLHNKKNHENPLGKTAFYDPSLKKISIYITGRHIKDIMRSLSHELVHHAQNCRGDLNMSNSQTTEGYAQTNNHLREMESEAYLVGNLMFRDFEDGLKSSGKSK